MFLLVVGHQMSTKIVYTPNFPTICVLDVSTKETPTGHFSERGQN